MLQSQHIILERAPTSMIIEMKLDSAVDLQLPNFTEIGCGTLLHCISDFGPRPLSIGHVGTNEVAGTSVKKNYEPVSQGSLASQLLYYR